MSKTTEQEMILTIDSGQKIVRVEIVDEGHSIKYYTIPEVESHNVIDPSGSQEFEEMFPIVDIENVSLDDSFMQYEPKTTSARRVKKSIIKAKEIGMKNFRIPAIDPSLDDDGNTIIYIAGRKPAIGKSPTWWYENAPRFMPSKNSRLRDKLEHDVVLGVMLIKYLVEEKQYEVEEAWKAVCVDSADLGHYRNSKDAKKEFETTGSRQIGKCYDFGNTFKIVKERESSGFVELGGAYNVYSFIYHLADVKSIVGPENNMHYDVGELVLDV